MTVYWCTPDPYRSVAWWYNLVPVAVYTERVGGRRGLSICLGFVWSGYLVIEIGGAE